MDCTLFDDLPDGLVLDILSRLPVKFVIQSTCVCKLWYSIIKTSSFVSSHLTRSISDPSRYYVYLLSDYSSSMFVISDNHLLTRHPDFLLPFVLKSLKFIATCNGLVCATEDYRDIYLFNPSIHKYKKLGFESSCYADWIHKFCHRGRLVDIKVGFGYCEDENDYKVLRIFNGLDRNGGCVLESKVEIYSLKNGKWRNLDLSIELSSNCSPVFVHGCLYWNVNRLYGPVGNLLCFDLKDEVFSVIEFPNTYLQLDCMLDRLISIKNGSVAVVAYEEQLIDFSFPCLKIYVFVLEKKAGGQVQWKELCYECADFDVVNCFGFSGVGRLLFVESDSEHNAKYVIAVDIDNSCAIEKLVMDSDDIGDGVTNVLESLVLLLD